MSSATESSTNLRADWRTPTVILVCGGLVLTLGDGRATRFRTLSAADERRPPLGPRIVRARDGGAEPRMGHAMQPFAGMIADRFGTAKVVLAGRSSVRSRARDHGACDDAAGARADVRRADRRRALRSHVQRHFRRARPRVSAGTAQHGARHLGRRRILRPVRDGARDAVAAVPSRLVRRAVGAWRASAS